MLLTSPLFGPNNYLLRKPFVAIDEVSTAVRLISPYHPTMHFCVYTVRGCYQTSKDTINPDLGEPESKTAKFLNPINGVGAGFVSMRFC